MTEREKARLAHAYAVRAVRKLGRELTSGTWAQRKPQGIEPDERRELQPLSVRESVTVITSAMVTAFKVGANSVIDAAEASLDAAVRELLDRALGE